MAYRALLFDLDGTLLNTLEDLANAYNRVLTTMGHKTHAVPEYRFRLYAPHETDHPA